MWRSSWMPFCGVIGAKVARILLIRSVRMVNPYHRGKTTMKIQRRGSRDILRAALQLEIPRKSHITTENLK